ncbi:MAG: hypothetical protein QNI92_10890 [Desulfobacterales bacterium]|nr:hypothetical protein [Desulfobacterales bacterium]
MAKQSDSQGFGITRQHVFGLPVDRSVLFSNTKRIYKKSVEKRQRKLIVKIPFIKPFLKENEKILLLTTGYSPVSFWEQLLTGWLFIYLERSMFVFTNFRIFHIPATTNYSYRDSIAQILYEDIKNIYMKRSAIYIEYKNGKIEKFLSVALREKAKVREIIKHIPLSGQPRETEGRTHLCPRCTSELKHNKYTCPHCKLKFKGLWLSRLLAIVFPGGGYYYTNHFFLGVINTIIEFLLLIYLVFAFIDFKKGLENSFLYLSVFLVAFLIEKIITVIHSCHFIREFIPKNAGVKPIGS